MTLPASGAISMSAVNVEVGSAATTNRALSWVQANTAYSYANLNSLHGLAWFQAVSSKNSYTRTTGSCSSNCVQNCQALDPNCQQCGDCGACPTWYAPNYAVAINAVNCNQCGYEHGTYLQANCNCNCNCYNCVCTSNNCNCDSNCATCVTGDTLIMTTEGPKPVMDIRPGEYVYDSDGVPVLVKEMHYVPLTGRTVWLVNNVLRITGDHAIKTTLGARSIEPARREYAMEWEFFQNFVFPERALEGLTLGSISGDTEIFSICRTASEEAMFSIVCSGGNGYLKLPKSGIVVEYLYPRKPC